MISIFERIRKLVLAGDVRISSHGYDELAEDEILARDGVEGIGNAHVIEEHLDYGQGPCVLILQRDKREKPIHVGWGIPKGTDSPAVLVTAYRPDRAIWSGDFTRRK